MGEAVTRNPPPIRLLLDAERAKERRGPDSRRLVGPVLAIANLFLLAYGERYLRNDRGMLFPILTAEMVLLLLLSASHMLSSATVSLERTAIFPLRPIDRFRYVIVGTLRSMPVLLWSGGTLLAFVILYHGSLAAAAGIPLLLALLILTVQGWLTIFMLLLRRKGINPAWVLAGPLCAALPAYPVAIGIAGLAAGDWGGAMIPLSVLVALLIVSQIAARRLC